MKIDTDGFNFDFPDAIDAFVFDEKDHTKQRFHGVPMKAVDLIVELETHYLFIEIKDFHDKLMYSIKNLPEIEELRKERLDSFRWLKRYLKYKFHDTLLFRFAENKVNKPIHYICVLTFDNALNSIMKKQLFQDLPTKKHKLWIAPLLKSCQVVNVTQWNANFPHWPLTQAGLSSCGTS